jgi:sporulation protein YlmC with PRC-barrel domain
MDRTQHHGAISGRELMAHREVRVEMLLSRQVVDAGGARVGRIEEIHAEEHGGELVVVEYLLGPYAVLERLSAWMVGRRIVQALGLGRRRRAYKVSWDEMDLSDPAHPRLTTVRRKTRARRTG